MPELTRLLLIVLCVAFSPTGQAQSAGAEADGSAPGALPIDVRSALQRAQIPASALSVVVIDAVSGERVLAQQAARSINPASLMKLLTTSAALDRLGPAWRWQTPVWLNRPVRDGVLTGDLHIQGAGDPGLNQERLWLLLRRVQQLGVREIRGDIVLDQRAFAVPDIDPGAFDGEPLRPYNVGPAALMLNLRSHVYTFVPIPASGVAQVLSEPPLAGMQIDRTVPLASGPCGDWRGGAESQLRAHTHPFRRQLQHRLRRVFLARGRPRPGQLRCPAAARPLARQRWGADRPSAQRCAAAWCTAQL